MNKYVNGVHALKDTKTPLLGLEIMTGRLLRQKH